MSGKQKLSSLYSYCKLHSGILFSHRWGAVSTNFLQNQTYTNSSLLSLYVACGKIYLMATVKIEVSFQQPLRLYLEPLWT